MPNNKRSPSNISRSVPCVVFYPTGTKTHCSPDLVTHICFKRTIESRFGKSCLAYIILQLHSIYSRPRGIQNASNQVQTRNGWLFIVIRGSTGDGYRCRTVIIGCKTQAEDNLVINHQTPQHKGAYRFLAAAARSLCLRFLNQFPTCVGVSPVAWASSLFLLGLG